jgi:AcrR family transcriptional regulator
MPPRDSSDTRSRLLQAGLQEFAARGIAGARVDHIAQIAGISKHGIYTYLGGKDGLFLAVLEACLLQPLAALPFDAADLAGFAGVLFDFYEERPDLARLAARCSIEPIPAHGRALLKDAFETCVQQLREAQLDGWVCTTADPRGLLLTLHALLLPSYSLPQSTRPATDPPDRRRQRRTATIKAVRRLTEFREHA